jgi:HEPN domain-containing protein
LGADPVLLAEVKGWLKRAASDLRVAELVRGAAPPLLDAALFHCQQVAEKALKAFLVLHGRTFRKTHSIEEIGEAVIRVDETLRAVVDGAVPLTEYAWRFRYPGEQDDPTVGETEEALRAAGTSLSVACPLARAPSNTSRPHRSGSTPAGTWGTSPA